MDQKAEIASLCSQLRFGSKISEIYESVDFNSPGDFLVKVLREAVDNRNQERCNRNIKQAGFPTVKTWADFEPNCLQLPEQYSFEWLRSGQFVEDHQNLILFGNPGTGKTHLATAIGLQACQKGKKVMFYRTCQLTLDLIKMFEKNEVQAFMHKIASLDLLILDEWGYVPCNETGTRLLFEVVSACYERRSIVITTNLAFSQWHTIFYDPRLTTAMLDRLIHHGLLIQHSGESYRLKNSLMHQ